MFQDPDKIADYLSSIGAASDAFLIGWRRTSLHLLIPDPQWINFLVKNARKCNQDLPVIGEAYLGQTAESRCAVAGDVRNNQSGIGSQQVFIANAQLFQPDHVFHEHVGLLNQTHEHFLHFRRERTERQTAAGRPGLLGQHQKHPQPGAAHIRHLLQIQKEPAAAVEPGGESLLRLP